MSFRPLQSRSGTVFAPWERAEPANIVPSPGPLPAPIPVHVPIHSIPEAYPTPPASPDLEDLPLCLPSLHDLVALASTGLYTPPLDTFEEAAKSSSSLLESFQSTPCLIPVVPLDAIDLDNEDAFDIEEEDEFEEAIEAGIELSLEDFVVETGEPAITSLDEVESTLSSTVSPYSLNPIGGVGFIPIPILLNTTNHIPHASTFRLASPSSLLSSLGGSRIFLLDASQTVWDRMPYSAAATAAATSLSKEVNEENSVEAMLGGDKEDGRLNGLQWGPRSRK